MGQSRLTIEDGVREVVRWARADRNPPVVVGIGGGSCAGKTSVSLALREGIADSGILEMDAYYHSRADVGEQVDVNFDEPGALDFTLLKRHLKFLRSGIGIHKPVYDFKKHVRSGTEWFAPCRVIILDGIFALHSSLEGWLDFGIFVDCDAVERLRRRLKRDRVERGRTWASVRHQFETTVQPMFLIHVEGTRTAANIVISNQKHLQL